jgi:hypothetical protein
VLPRRAQEKKEDNGTVEVELDLPNVEISDSKLIQ